MVEKLVKIGILFDFYGKLLSDRQYLVIDLYYIHDLSLVEIGEEMNVTRQGVFDLLKRAEQKLYEFEENLGLVKKFYSSHTKIQEIIDISKDIIEISEKYKIQDIKERAGRITQIGKKILNNSREVIDYGI